MSERRAWHAEVAEDGRHDRCRPPPMPCPLNLGLQGGGAHGAFTWGVLDVLLEDERFDIARVSASSAGAMNAVALAHGWMEGGRTGARAALRRFWTALAATVPVDVTHHDGAGGVHLAPVARLWLAWSRYVGPAQFNPLELNPLRTLLEQQFDFAALRRRSPIRLFVAATHADSGRLRLFRDGELTVDAVLASACLPTLFHAPRIDGQAYWDGAYAANPAVFPLLGGAPDADVLLVLLSPLEMPPLPAAAGAAEIQARIAEIAFTAAFRREMQALAHARVAVRRRWWERLRRGDRAGRARLHLIEGGPPLEHLAGETRLAVDRRFFDMLHALGRDSALRWLARHGEAVGRCGSADLGRFA